MNFCVEKTKNGKKGPHGVTDCRKNGIHICSIGDATARNIECFFSSES